MNTENKRFGIGEQFKRNGIRMMRRAASGATLVTMALNAVGCGIAGSSVEITPNISPTVEVTDIFIETPTPTLIPTPTETLTPEVVEIPGSISSKEILAECPVKLEIETALVGKVVIEGKTVEINYPDIKTKITFAIDGSYLESAPEGWALKDLVLNTEYWDSPDQLGEGGAARQALSDILYTHYRAWQYNKGEDGIEERKSKTFENYLEMISEGGDGSHPLVVNTKSSTVLPNETINIDPLGEMIVLFTKKGNYIEGWGGFSFDKSRNILIARTRPSYPGNYISELSETLADSEKRFSGYRDLIGILQIMSYPAKNQKSGSMKFRVGDEVNHRREVGRNVYEIIINNNVNGSWYDGTPPFITVYK